jgi:oligopeptide/dipeptide ABC transporter ATP-binding protein
MAENDRTPILEFDRLHTNLMTAGGIVHAVQGVDLRVFPGEILGIVGESGCGKTIMVGSVMRLHDEKRAEYLGEIRFEGRDVLKLSMRELRRMRGKEAVMIFQDPMVSLNPIMTVGEQISEIVRAKDRVSRAAARARALELLNNVGVMPADKRYRQYPFELSGGMMQRVMIAIALSCNPKLLIADEPTTALDVTIQSQILELIRSLQKQNGMTVLLVTHNLGVVAEICDRVAVMYAGRIMEEATAAEIFDNPAHPYTVALMKSRPRDGVRYLHSIPGVPPPLTEVFRGCAFARRCEKALPECENIEPEACRVQEGHTVYCHRAAERVAARRTAAANDAPGDRRVAAEGA